MQSIVLGSGNIVPDFIESTFCQRRQAKRLHYKFNHLITNINCAMKYKFCETSQLEDLRPKTYSRRSDEAERLLEVMCNM
jgi:Txe/YoeB family toxin of Txe-Axe toxin-antitoxin module